MLQSALSMYITQKQKQKGNQLEGAQSDRNGDGCFFFNSEINAVFYTSVKQFYIHVNKKRSKRKSNVFQQSGNQFLHQK